MSQEVLPFPFVDVECHAGYRGEEMPRRFRLGERQVEIAEVVDSWLAPDHRYFKVNDSQGDLYILRNDVAAQRWEVGSRLHGALLMGLGGIALFASRHAPVAAATRFFATAAFPDGPALAETKMGVR